MKLHEKNGNYYVDSEYGKLLVDNGSGGTQLLRSEATAHLPAVRTTQQYGSLGATEREVVLLQRLCCGDLTGYDLEVSLDDWLPLLGNDVLKDYAYTFDLRNLQMDVIDPFRDGIRCRMGKRRHLYVGIEVNGVPGLAMLDTGCGVSVIDRRFLEETDCAVSPVSVEKVTDSSGATQDVERVILAELRIHETEFPPHPFLVMDYSGLNRVLEYPIVATIGTSTMREKKFSFNQKDGYLRIEDYE